MKKEFSLDLEELEKELLEKGIPEKQIAEKLKEFEDSPQLASDVATKAIKNLINKEELKKKISRKWK